MYLGHSFHFIANIRHICYRYSRCKFLVHAYSYLKNHLSIRRRLKVYMMYNFLLFSHSKIDLYIQQTTISQSLSHVSYYYQNCLCIKYFYLLFRKFLRLIFYYWTNTQRKHRHFYMSLYHNHFSINLLFTHQYKHFQNDL